MKYLLALIFLSTACLHADLGDVIAAPIEAAGELVEGAAEAAGDVVEGTVATVTPRAYYYRPSGYAY